MYHRFAWMLWSKYTSDWLSADLITLLFAFSECAIIANEYKCTKRHFFSYALYRLIEQNWLNYLMKNYKRIRWYIFSAVLFTTNIFFCGFCFLPYECIGQLFVYMQSNTFPFIGQKEAIPSFACSYKTIDCMQLSTVPSYLLRNDSTCCTRENCVAIEKFTISSRRDFHVIRTHLLSSNRAQAWELHFHRIYISLNLSTMLSGSKKIALILFSFSTCTFVTL